MDTEKENIQFCNLCGEEIITPEKAYEIHVEIRKRTKIIPDDIFIKQCVCRRCRDLFIACNFKHIGGLRALFTDDLINGYPYPY